MLILLQVQVLLRIFIVMILLLCIIDIKLVIAIIRRFIIAVVVYITVIFTEIIMINKSHRLLRQFFCSW